MNAFHKLILSFISGILVYSVVPDLDDTLIHVMIGWDAGSLVLLILSWISFVTIDAQQIAEQSKKQDESRFLIFLIVLISALASMTPIVELFIHKTPFLPVAIGGLVLSWCLVHTIFTLRYAHLFYGNDAGKNNDIAGGIIFPEDKHPDYLDFAYFSFVIGMTFQVSDVEVSSKRIRRLVLMHGLVSFCFNTFIVALTINVISSMMQK